MEPSEGWGRAVGTAAGIVLSGGNSIGAAAGSVVGGLLERSSSPAAHDEHHEARTLHENTKNGDVLARCKRSGAAPCWAGTSLNITCFEFVSTNTTY
jgi:hypothetical protein